MNLYEFAPIRALISVANSVVTTLTDLLEPIAAGSAAALAIVVFTLGVRAVLIPVGVSQARAERTRRRIAPKLAELQKRYKKQPEVLQRKMMELYRAENSSPFAGFGPVLLQMPVLLAVYGLFITPTIGGAPNHLLENELLGNPLGTSLITAIGAGTTTPLTWVLYAVIVVVIVAAAQTSRRLLMPPPMPTATERAPGVPDLSGLTRILGFLPFLTAVFAAFVPLAAALYLMVTTTWTLVERLVLRRLLNPPAPAAAAGEVQPNAG
ncbi:YidC/Oxa1 family membrane protein insertase [Occultella kanbiaonis]|uniref:YidC/Oxa1 family membrane protein insertase n=1 Tax=Occultella kanbiaonis TaxID=2675754 RepID=UPI0012B702BA|nr:membrane protein insertase YidC [Occultella kanbiaonis]